MPFSFRSALSRRLSCLVLSDDDAHVIESPGVRHVREVLVRAVEINVLVMVAIEKIADVERAVQVDEVTNEIRMAERDVGRMVGAETRAADAIRWQWASRRAKSKTSCTITFS